MSLESVRDHVGAVALGYVNGAVITVDGGETAGLRTPRSPGPAATA